MSVVYLSHNARIYPHRQTVEKDGELISVRPKTFALLLLLLEHPQQVLSKKFLLDKIWDDVKVEEAVLVQSIRELRQLFNSTEIIQTYPRKGYAWSGDVKTQTITTEQEIISNATSKAQKYPVYIIAAIAAVITLSVFLFTFFHQKPAATEVVVILPVKNEIQGKDYQWISLGAMDQLIHYLTPNEHTQIMSTEYVLQLMQHAQIPRHYNDTQIARIFEVSGASLVVEIKLSGSVEEYRLDYKLRRQRDIKSGVLFDRSLEGTLQKLGSTIATYTDSTTGSPDVLAQTAFTNELMARALEKMDQQEYQQAASLLQSLKQLDANNIMARQVLAQTLLQLRDYNAANAELEFAIAKASENERSRLYFLLAEVQFAQTLFDKALITLEQAEKLTRSQNDILYLGYIMQLRGNIQQQLGLLTTALSSYEEAIKYFGIIRCPIGTSITHLQMSSMLYKNGKPDQAKAQYHTAKQLITQHKLYKLEPMLAEMNEINR